MTNVQARPSRYAVPAQEQRQVIELLDKYLNHRDGYPFDSDALWFFKPWRGSRSRPSESGVYATVHNSFYGFSYYAADFGYWLMSFDSVGAAHGLGASFRRDVQAGKTNALGACRSRHQNKQWSSAPLEGITEMPYWYEKCDGQLVVNEEALALALVRQAVDPKLAQRTCGQ